MNRSNRTTGEYDRMLHFLELKDSYPHQPEKVTHVQTHISHVFIASPYVYKIKKPVDFGFLDYSSLDKRNRFCHREIELNRRLCEGAYLAVVPIRKQEDKFVLEAEQGGTVAEYAVKMRELPEDGFLHTYLERETLTRRHLNRVAEKLSRFYRGQEPGPEVVQYGSMDMVRVNTDENFSQARPFIGDTIEAGTFNAVRHYTDRYYDRNAGLFDRRVAQKRIVDGHGDLHLEHIHIRPDRICIYDCIEFNERFRCGDLAADLAFLAMDLDFNDRWSAERYFVNRMVELLNDADLKRIIDFYKCYRAFVKGKVKSLQSREPEVSPVERRNAAATASRYFDLALRYAVLGSQPVVLIFMGRIGSGKSTLAGRLSDILSVAMYSSDRIRKSMAGLPLHERTPESKRKELYSEEMSDRTYGKLQQEALGRVEQGESVILDATFSNREGRGALVRILEGEGVDYLFVETQATDETIRRRLRQRDGEKETVSDARLEDFELIDSRYEPPVEMDRHHHLPIDTGRSPEETVARLCLKLADRHLDAESGPGSQGR